MGSQADQRGGEQAVGEAAGGEEADQRKGVHQQAQTRVHVADQLKEVAHGGVVDVEGAVANSRRRWTTVRADGRAESADGRR